MLSNVRVPLDSLSAIDQATASKLPNATAALPRDPEHFAVELEVFHLLHCLDSIRRTFYPDRYTAHIKGLFLENGSRDYLGREALHYGESFPGILPILQYDPGERISGLLMEYRSLYRCTETINNVSRGRGNSVLAMDPER